MLPFVRLQTRKEIFAGLSLKVEGARVDDHLKFPWEMSWKIQEKAGREDPKAVSPLNFATCFDRATTYQLEGRTLGDVMLLEDTDPDGDIVWLYHAPTVQDLPYPHLQGWHHGCFA